MSEESKSAEETAVATTPDLVPQTHGGALLSGGKPGNPGGGRPPSEIRQRLRGSFTDRIKILEEIADNPDSSPADRMKAIDMLAKYGLGTTQEVTGEDGAPLHTNLTVRFIKPEGAE